MGAGGRRDAADAFPPAEDPVWHRWQRPLRTTEMALCASHAAAWRRMLELGRPCLVLEDDAVLASETPGFLTGAEAVAGVDHISLETRARKKLVARRSHGTLPMRRLYQDRTGSAASIIYPVRRAKAAGPCRPGRGAVGRGHQLDLQRSSPPGRSRPRRAARPLPALRTATAAGHRLADRRREKAPP
jgi:GR25 family glycosyltransferase involved in LPS biosynthesis